MFLYGIEDMTLVELGRALNCPSRQAILAIVLREGPVAVGRLAARLDLSASTMSYHVDRLNDAGLTTTRRKGRRTFVLPVWQRLRVVGVRAR
jgi:DNA-binding transcriptional ArsR family regulator